MWQCLSPRTVLLRAPFVVLAGSERFRAEIGSPPANAQIGVSPARQRQCAPSHDSQMRRYVLRGPRAGRRRAQLERRSQPFSRRRLLSQERPVRTEKRQLKSHRTRLGLPGKVGPGSWLSFATDLACHLCGRVAASLVRAQLKDQAEYERTVGSKDEAGSDFE